MKNTCVKTLICLIALLVLLAFAPPGNAVLADDGNQFNKSKTHSTAPSDTSSSVSFVVPTQPGTILLLDDGGAPGQEGKGALERFGYKYTYVSSAAFATVDLSQFDIIFVAWLPSQAEVDALYSRRVDLANWLSNGGGIVVNAECQGWVTNPYSFLPMSFDASYSGEEAVHIEDPTHPLVTGLTDDLLSNWGVSVHGTITQWPPSAKIVARATESDSPHILAVQYGAGRIVVASTDPEYHILYGTGDGPWQLLYNELNWACRSPIRVTSPIGGETWRVGSSKAITWTSSGVTGNVNIKLSRNSGATYTTIVANTPNDGSQAWTVTAPVTTTARIQVVSVSTPTIKGTSNADFTIATPPTTPTLVSPTSGFTVPTLTPTLDWNDSAGVVSYNVQLSTTSSFTTMVVVGATLGTSIYTVPGGLAWNTVYYWRVNAANAAGNSAWSAIRTFKTALGPPPTTPSNLVATAVSATQINLVWDDNSNNETGFKIERKTGTGRFAQVGTVAANVHSFSNTSGLAAETTYTYRVRAYLGTTLNSNYSNEDDATTLPRYYLLSVRPNQLVYTPGDTIIFSGSLKTSSGKPAAGFRIGVDDPVTQVCTLGATTDLSGNFTYEAQSNRDSKGVYAFTFYGGNKPTYVAVSVNASSNLQLSNISHRIPLGVSTTASSLDLALSAKTGKGLPSATQNQLKQSLTKITQFMGTAGKRTLIDFVSNPLNDFVILTDVVCLAGAQYTVPGLIACPVAYDYTLKAFGKSAAIAIAETAIDSTGMTASDKVNWKNRVKAFDCVIGYVGLDSSSAVADFAGTGWTCGSAISSVMTDSMNRKTLTIVATPSASSSSQDSVGLVIFQK